MSTRSSTPQPVSLSGEWQFQLDPDGTLNHASLQPDRAIRVPLPWQAAMPELQRYSGYAWYRREFSVDESFLAGEVQLRFGAVDYWCQVWVNSTLVGEHEGGYTPFAFQVGHLLRPGTNQVTVRVYDSAQESIAIERWPDYAAEQRAAAAGPPFDARHIPHGKQEWYINCGGIWQDVTLTPVPVAFVEQLHITPDIAAGTATVNVTFAGDLDALGDATLRLALSGVDGPVAQEELRLQGGQRNARATLTIPAPRLWELDDPHLYTLQANLTLAGGAGQQRSERFGMRSFTYRNGQFLLNGQPIFLLSALDQDLYPDTIYTVPSDEFLRDQFRKAKELGLNNLRCHIKPPDPRYLDLADEMGLLVWAEIPSWRTFTLKGTLHEHQLDIPPELQARVERTLEEMVARDYNHPSLVIWTLVNEDWGTTLPLSAADRQWVATLYDRCKQLDPTRLAVDNSPCLGPWAPNVHVKSDIDDFHIYAAIPDHTLTFATTMEQLALRPLWTYSAHGDTQRRGDEPLVLSEFGNWGLPSPAALRAYYGGDPPWFDLGPWWSRWEGEPGWPKGAEERFQRLGLDAVWGDYEQFARATQLHQYEAMKFEIEAMRRHPTLAGYVITEFTDAYWESNGLLDFVRNPKAYHDTFRAINSPDVIVPWLTRRAYWSNERPRVEVSVSHYSGRAGDGSTLSWQVEGGAQGELALPPLARGETRHACTLRLKLPALETAGAARVHLTLRGSDGAELARNTLELTVFPATAQRSASSGSIAVIAGTHSMPADLEPPALIDTVESAEPIETASTTAEAELSEEDGETAPLGVLLANAGYQVTERLGPEVELAISNRPTEALLRWVREGGKLLFLCESASPFFWAQGRGGAYSGNWVTSYSWLRPGIHTRLPESNPLGLAFVGVMPQHTIVGLPLEDPAIHGDILAGMIAGWGHHPAAHTVQFRYGKGRVVMTTFRLRAMLNRSPTALAMLHDLVDYLRSERCQPALKASY